MKKSIHEFRRFLFATIMLLGVAMTAWGETVTFTYSDYKGSGTTSSGSSYTMDDKTYVSIGDTKFFGNNSYAHFYAGGTITVTPKSGATISKVAITSTGTSYNGYESSGTYTASTGSVAKNSSNNAVVEWTGSATSAFTLEHTKQIRWTSIEVTYTTGGGSPTQYSVTVADNIIGGSVTASPTSAVENATITLTATPATGYEFTSWNVTNASTSAAIDVASNKFAMPAAAVNVSAVFTAVAADDDTKWTYNFNSSSAYPAGFPTATGTKAAALTKTISGHDIIINAPDAYYIINNGNDATRGFFFGKTTAANSKPTEGTAYLGFPARSGYKLTKVVVTTTAGVAGSVKMNIYDADWTAQSTELTTVSNTKKEFTFALSSTTANTEYRLASGSSGKNLQFDNIVLTWEEAEDPTPEKTLTDITVKTAPTKVEYNEGENFDPAGLVITASYSDDSSEDITYANNASKFTFAPATTVALTTENTKVTITYGGQSVDQVITVNAAVVKSEQTLTFAESSYSFNLNEEVADFTNTLSGANTAVTYESSNTAVATVDATGLVHVVTTAEGTATITATAAEDESYYGATKSYTIKVVDPSKLSETFAFSTANNGITLNATGANEPGSDTEAVKGNITVFSAGGKTSAGATLQIFKGQSMTVTAATGYAIVGIDFTYATSCYPFSEAIPEGTDVSSNKTATGKQDVTFTAVAPAKSLTFTNVSGGQTKVNKMVVYYKEYTDPKYTISVAECENGTVSVVDDLAEAIQGAIITLAYEADGGYMLDAWAVKDADENDIEVSADNKFTMPAKAVTVAATFKLIPVAHGITVAADIENGTVAIEGDITEAIEGTIITLTATPNPGYEFETWMVKGADETPIDVTDDKFMMPDQAVSVSASFTVITTFTSPNLGYDTFGLTPEGTNVYAQPDVEENTTTFNGITLTTVKGDGNKVRFDKTLARIYKDNSLVIAAPAGKAIAKVVLTKGSTSASDWAGGETVTPADTYDAETSTWTGEAKKVTFGFGGTHRLASVTVTLVDYVDPTYAITCATGIENGEVSADFATAIEGQEVTLTATPSIGCEFVAWNVYKTDDEETKVTVTENKFTMPAYAVTVSASFQVTPIIPTITVDGTLALEAGEADGTIVVSYTNKELAEVALFSDAVCETAFAGDWFVAILDAENNVEYHAEENTDADPRTVYIQITAMSSTTDYATAVVAVTQQGGVPTYAITIADGIEHGTVETSAEFAHAGDEITLTATPASAAYIFEAWNVKGADETVIEVSAENKFTMPAQAVTVSATFKEKPAVVVTLPHTGTFNGSAADYTEGWTTNATGLSRSDCVVVGKDEHLTSPQMNLSEYKEITIAFTGRKMGTLSGSQATVDASIAGTSLGTIGFTGSTATASMGEIKFTPTSEMTAVKIVFTCTNATSAGSTHGAGFNTITITGKLNSTDPVVLVEESVDLAFDATSGEIAYEIENPVAETELTATSTTEWISNIVVAAEKVTFDATANDGAAREGVITLTYGAISKNIAVKQAKFVVDYATLPLSVAGGLSGEGLLEVDGISGKVDGSDYKNGTHKVKFSSNNNHNIQIKTNERPGVCTFSVMGCAGAGTSTFLLQGSADGANWTDVETLNATFTESNEVIELVSSNDFAEDVRYIKVLFLKPTGNVNCGLGAFTIAQYVAPTYELPITRDFGTMYWDKNWTAVGDVEVYYGKWNGDDACIDLHPYKGTVVPAGEGVIVRAVGQSFVTLTATAAEAGTIEDNEFKGTVDPAGVARNGDKTTLVYNKNSGNFAQYIGSDNIPAYRAYMEIPKISSAPQNVRMRIVNTTTDIEGADANVNVQKQMINGQLFIIRDGKMYNVQGVLVK